MRDGWTTAWFLWIVMFGTIELPALLNRRLGDTLSEHIWKWFSIKTKSTGWRLRRFSLVAFLSWMMIHLLTGWI